MGVNADNSIASQGARPIFAKDNTTFSESSTVRVVRWIEDVTNTTKVRFERLKKTFVNPKPSDKRATLSMNCLQEIAKISQHRLCYTASKVVWHQYGL